MRTQVDISMNYRIFTKLTSIVVVHKGDFGKTEFLKMIMQNI